MKTEINAKIKADSKYVIYSKSAVYLLMNHERYESYSNSINLNSLNFSNRQMNDNYNVKLMMNARGKPSPEYIKCIRYYYSYTTISLLILLGFAVILFNEGELTGNDLIVYLIGVLIILILFYVLLFLIFHSKACMLKAKTLYLVIILIKVLFIVLSDTRGLCKINGSKCMSQFLPIGFLIIGEIVMARTIVFHCYINIFVIGFVSLLSILVYHVLIQGIRDYDYLAEVSIIGIFIVLQTAECYQRDLRMKHIYWRAEKEDIAAAQMKIPDSSEKDDDDEDIIKCCDETLQNLKYLSKVIIYKDSSQMAKESIKDMNLIRQSLSKNKFSLLKIELAKDIDEEDYAFISENFMDIHSGDRSSKAPTASRIFRSNSIFPFPNYGVSELQSVLSHLSKNWNFDAFFVYESTGKSISIVSSYLITKWGINNELEIPEQISQNYFQKLEEVSTM